MQSCKPGAMVCSQSTGIKFESGCHARCAGVTDLASCDNELGSNNRRNSERGTCLGISLVGLLSALTIGATVLID